MLYNTAQLDMIKITKKEINKAIRSFKNRYPGFLPWHVENVEKILKALVGEQIEFYGSTLDNNGAILFGIGNGIDPDENPKEGLTLNVFVGEHEIEVYRYDKKEFLDFVADFYESEIEEVVECIKKQFAK